MFISSSYSIPNANVGEFEADQSLRGLKAHCLLFITLIYRTCMRTLCPSLLLCRCLYLYTHIHTHTHTHTHTTHNTRTHTDHGTELTQYKATLLIQWWDLFFYAPHINTNMQPRKDKLSRNCSIYLHVGVASMCHSSSPRPLSLYPSLTGEGMQRFLYLKLLYLYNVLRCIISYRCAARFRRCN